MAQPQQIQQPWPLLASQHFAWNSYSSYTSTVSALDCAVFDRNGYAVLSPTVVPAPQQFFATPNELQTDLPTAYLQSIPERMLQSGNNNSNVPRPIVFEEKCVEKKGPRKFECSKCGHRVRDSYNLRHHMLAHTGERPYKCAYCPKAFRRSNLRRQHVEVVHGIPLMGHSSSINLPPPTTTIIQ